jgi:EmrB/QacA subfamily drug resistance transporter
MWMLPLLLGSFLGVLDPFVVTVALPVIRDDLGASPAQTQWLFTGYSAMYGMGLISGSRLGDRYGRRRLFLSGTAAYAGASVVAGIAPAIIVLIVARLVQGLAAAAMLPQVLSIIRSDCPEPERARAIGWYGATIGLGVVCGPAVGGLLVGAAGWRAIFLVNLPLGLVVLAGAALTVGESRAPVGRGLDLLGAGLGAGTLLAFIGPASSGPQAGWPGWSVGLLASVPILLAIFVAHERRVERRCATPMVPLRLFRERRFTTGIVAILLLYGAGAGAPLVFVLSYYLQDQLDRSASSVGLTFAPLGLGFAVASACAARLVRGWGPLVPRFGAGIVVAALLALIGTTVVAPPELQPALFMPVLLLAGIGQGLAANPAIAAVLGAAPSTEAGPAAALLLVTTQIGNIVGVTLAGAVYFASSDPTGAGDRPAVTAALTALALATLGTMFVLRALPGGDLGPAGRR